MIGFFPDPYPDELLYSVCARYAERVNYPNKQMVMKDLFGKRGLSAIVDFPNRLNYLLSVIPHHNFLADEIINKNTLFPFYEPFLSRERALQIREEMKSSAFNHLHSRLATNISQVKMPEFLRFCPLCLTNDRRLYGETYWHRIHQLGGIFVCPTHNCFLQNSSIRLECESSYLFYSANKLLSGTKTPYFVNAKEISHQIHLELALNAKWILAQPNLSLKSGELRERYHNLLLREGYAFYNGRVRRSEFIKAFKDFYPIQILKDLGSPLKNSYDSWVTKLVDTTYIDVLFHPVLHFLLLRFLKTNLEHLFTNFETYRPFSFDPYPCLNIAASHYQDLRIDNCKILDSVAKKDKVRRPMAIFTCDCGFSYQRAGPDLNLNDKFRYDLVRNYGKVWESKLAQDWSNLNLSLSEIARRFKTTTLLISRHAIRLNLPMNTKGTRKTEGYARYRNPESYLEEQLKSNRREWLKIIRTYSTLSRRELYKKFPNRYLWLQRNDSMWLEKHLPQPRKCFRKKDRLNWKEIDNELCEKIEIACEEILNESRVTRVSITEVIKRVGDEQWINKRHLKLPKVTQLTNEKLETFEDYMLRKLEAAEKYYVAINKVPSQSQLIRKATINNNTTRNSSKIQKSIDETITRIEMKIT